MAIPIDRVVSIPITPFKKPIEPQLMELCETLPKLRPFFFEGRKVHIISWLDYRELRPKDGKRRFHILRAFTERDK